MSQTPDRTSSESAPSRAGPASDEATAPASAQSSSKSAAPVPHGFDLFGGLAAILLPGLGHVVQGRVKRGILAGAGVLGMFFGGIFIGGIDAIDSKEDRLWFFGQALVGPLAFGADWVHQNMFKAYEETRQTPEDVSRRGAQPPATKPRTVAPGERVEVKNGRRVIVGADGPLDPPNMKGRWKPGEIGVLYATIAGMVNLIVVLDALLPPLTGTDRRVRNRGATGASIRRRA